MIISDEDIKKYSKYFNYPNVMKTALDTKKAIESGNKLKNNDEIMASIVLTILLVQGRIKID